MKALITGGSGFVGGHLAAYLTSQGDEVSSQDSGDFDITRFDDTKSAIAAVAPDVIYHLAGLSFVPECEENFPAALQVNVHGTENILKSVRDLKSNAVTVVISSGDAYGKVDPQKLPSSEIDEPNPVNNYSLSKVFAEKLAIRAREVFHQRVVVMRPFNHIGPGQSTRFAISSFAEQLAQMKKGKAEPVLRVGNLSARRDLTDVRDIVRGYRLAAQKGDGLYNLCSGQAVSMEYVLDLLIKVSGVNVKVEIDPARLRPSDNPETRGSFVKAKEELGWTPQISLEQSLKDCFESFL